MFDKSESPGIGCEILVDMMKYISPSHVVKINISAASKNLPGGTFWLDGDCDGMVNIIEINSACQNSFNRSLLVQKDARLLRDLRIMAYFRQCFPSDKPITTIKELAYALASHSPYEVPISSIKIRHLHCQVPSTEMYYSSNATNVGLAVSSEESENLPWCVGLVLQISIHFVGKNKIIVAAKKSPQEPGISFLEKVNLFLQGFIQIPTCQTVFAMSSHGNPTFPPFWGMGRNNGDGSVGERDIHLIGTKRGIKLFKLQTSMGSSPAELGCVLLVRSPYHC
ncbi:polynucleotide 5'-hydroxyl-kinase NOL9-like [Durio zibethinus]|uniref:Polynucleotide 5'-hydroxyl-kinase NOL9-like n=1 Tax=Durio zibethinus TaxID=66656 RepID=A0A6P5YA01_DURZI|nr:polynucleotide 5'-hydroxyl-kinase NOL9-like [Durio zibethinus]